MIDFKNIVDRMNSISLHQCNREKDGSPRWAMHPLTCGNNSSHPPLFPWFDGEQICLICSECDYTQKNSSIF
jgi:hypothetical protein